MRCNDQFCEAVRKLITRAHTEFVSRSGAYRARLLRARFTGCCTTNDCQHQSFGRARSLTSTLQAAYCKSLRQISLPHQEAWKSIFFRRAPNQTKYIWGLRYGRWDVMCSLYVLFLDEAYNVPQLCDDRFQRCNEGENLF